MAEQLVRRHALESFLQGRANSAADTAGVTVSLEADQEHVNLRGRPDDDGFRRGVEGALQQSLPLIPNTFTRGPQIVYWLGPDEWLISAARIWRVHERLLALPWQDSMAVTAQSGGLLRLDLSGDSARAVLAKGCTLDLHESAFPVGRCAQTLLAKADVLVALADESPTYSVLVRRSFAEYLALWLEHSGSEFGIAFHADRQDDE